MRFDWSKIASYPALNFKMAALRFVSFTEEMMKAVKKMKFGRALLKRKI